MRGWERAALKADPLARAPASLLKLTWVSMGPPNALSRCGSRLSSPPPRHRRRRRCRATRGCACPRRGAWGRTATATTRRRWRRCEGCTPAETACPGLVQRRAGETRRPTVLSFEDPIDIRTEFEDPVGIICTVELLRRSRVLTRAHTRLQEGEWLRFSAKDPLNSAFDGASCFAPTPCGTTPTLSRRAWSPQQSRVRDLR
jgi:hypothetical protein